MLCLDDGRRERVTRYRYYFSSVYQDFLFLDRAELVRAPWQRLGTTVSATGQGATASGALVGISALSLPRKRSGAGSGAGSGRVALVAMRTK